MSAIFGGSQSTNNGSNASASQSTTDAISQALNSAMSNSTNNSNSQSTNNSNSQSASGNLSYPMLSQALSGQVTNGTNASNDLAALLGVGGDPAAQQQALQNWQNSTGYQFGLNQGTGAITGSNATKGLLDSGATAKALDTYGQNYANTQYQNYLNPLTSLITSGNQAASTISGAGGVSDSTSNSSGQSTSNSSGQSNSLSNGQSLSLSNGQSSSLSNGTTNGQSSSKPGIGGFLGALM